MDYDDDFLKTIPNFLRRQDRVLNTRSPANAPGTPNDRGERIAPSARQADDGPLTRPPGPAKRVGEPPRAPAAPLAEAVPGGIAKTARTNPFVSALHPPKPARAKRDAVPEARETDPVAQARRDTDEDAAFQVTLPRGVIRQIRVLAAEEGTTHRAIILRSLRQAGLAVPEGADVDRRTAAARRRQQAEAAAV
jgi:hypothetical protein